MAHELTIRADGKVEMAYAQGVKPWHGLGNDLPAGAEIEAWMSAAGMDWRILRSKVRYLPNAGAAGDVSQWRTIDDRHVLLRNDSGDHLGIVSDEYHVVQPKAVLEFFRSLVGEMGFELRTAGTLFGGKKFWALASTGQSGSVVDARDKIDDYLMLCTSADGSMATEARRTTVTVVCNNTLQMSRGERGKDVVAVSHRTRFNDRKVKQALGLETDSFAEAMATFRRLAATPVAPVQQLEMTAGLFDPAFGDKDATGKDKVLRSASVRAVGDLAINGRAMGSQLAGVQGTAYGWLQAVTQYVDHAGRAKSPSHRLNSAWFGKGADVKARALEMATAVSNGESWSAPITLTEGALLEDILAQG